MATTINCPFCGKLTDLKLENCPHCGGNLQKAAQAPAASPKSARHTCPNCHALVQDGDIICVACGTNLLTGQKIAVEKRAVAAEKSQWAWRIWGVIAAVVAAVILVGLFFFLFRGSPVARAVKLGQEGRFLEASSLLEQHLKSHGQDARAYFELGKLQWTTNQAAQAAQSFKEAARLDPENRQALLYSAAVLAGASPENTVGEIAALESLRTLDPTDRQSWYLLGLTKGVTNDVTGQIDALKKAAALGAANPTIQGQLGVAYALKGDYAAAKREIQAALQAQPEEGRLRAALGLVAGLQGDTDGAIAALQDAVQKQADIGGDALAELGMLLVAQGRYGEAETYLRQALAQDTNDADVRFFLAASLRGQGQLQKALTEFESIANGTTPLAGKAAAVAAQIYLSLDNVDRSREVIEKASQKGTQGADYYTVLGRVRAASEDQAAAQEAFTKASQVDPTYAPAHLESGLLYLQRDAPEQGLRELELYLKLADPKAPDSRVNEVTALVDQLKQSAGAGPPLPVAAMRRPPGRAAEPPAEPPVEPTGPAPEGDATRPGTESPAGRSGT